MAKILLLILFFSCHLTAIAQESKSSSNIISSQNRFELRIGTSYSVVEFEYSRFLTKYLSGDVTVGTTNPGVRIGASVFPISILFVQTSLGSTSYKSYVVDGPTFKPEYVYSLRTGLLFPIGNLPIMFGVSFGRMTLVQNDYNPHGGFVLENSMPLSHRKEIQYENFTSVGISVKF
jgi:hypothetical protein